MLQNKALDMTDFIFLTGLFEKDTPVIKVSACCNLIY